MSGAICAICYEDARPICEDLQSISACGHVFHELCLQQWMEYCPAGRKPTCPLCKQSCTTHDVHRLYFQSAGGDSTQPQRSPSKAVETDVDDLRQINNIPAVRKLETQLAAAKSALQARNEQLKELDSQAVANLCRAEKAEAAHLIAKREFNQCQQGLYRVQEELKGCSAAREMLQEKNVALSKDLAVHKLVGDADLGEEDILRLANVGSGSNKCATIETLTKSLILRNRSYKELMARCNELGMGESRALRKSEKTIEQLKKLKARVQELEKLLEEKENAGLRVLNKRNLKSQADNVRSAQGPVMCSAESKAMSTPTSPPLQQVAASGVLSRGRITASRGRVPGDLFKQPGFLQDLDTHHSDSYVIPRIGRSELPLLNIVKERGQTAIEHAYQTCLKNLHVNEDILCSRKRGCPEDFSTAGHGEDDNPLQLGISYWIIKAQHLLQKIELLNKSNSLAGSEEVSIGQNASAPNCAEERTPTRTGQTSWLTESNSSALCTGVHQAVFSPTVNNRPEVGTPTFSKPPSQKHGPADRNPAHIPETNSYGGFAKRAPSGRLSSPSSTFILSGADGRGGRVTIFKPPALSVGGVAMGASKKLKKPKVSGTGSYALQIEHFFGRVRS